MYKNPGVITCFRHDGTKTWAKVMNGSEDHDLAHYAVEKKLNFRNAFFGLVADGLQLFDFIRPYEERPKILQKENLPVECIQADYIVNLLQTQKRNSGNPKDFIPMLTIILSEKNIPFPEDLDEESLGEIRSKYNELVDEYKNLRIGHEMSLIF